MTVKNALKTFNDTIKKIQSYGFASTMIYYDSVTAAPEKSAEKRGSVLEFLSEQEYKLKTSKRMTDAVAFLLANKDKLTDKERRTIEFYSIDAEYVASIPKKEYLEYCVLINDAEAVWHKAKLEDDFEAFKPYLERIFESNKKFALYYKPTQKPYDTLLSMYEPGLNCDKADEFFSSLRERIVPLIKKIKEAEQIDDHFLYRSYPIEKQRIFSDRLMEVMDLDRKRCAIGETEHPFTLEFSKNDVRITTHYHENNLVSSMYSVIHEGGHAMYELGSGDEYEGTVLSGGISMGIHESQSRLYENIIGRSREFISVIYPIAKELFFEQLSDVTEEMLYKAVNKSEPSLIRTEADELTYSLHVMVRYEIEKGVIEGRYKVSDLPKIWNEKMMEYLGVTVPDDKKGVLQDSHWSGGAVGYFPSYALGSAYGAMFIERMKEEINVNEAIKSGKLTKINEWLGEKIHRHACRYEPSELINMVCGKDFDPEYYVNYLENKYKGVYGIN